MYNENSVMQTKRFPPRPRAARITLGGRSIRATIMPPTPLLTPTAERWFSFVVVASAERLSLSPAEVERVGVRGKGLATIDQFRLHHLRSTPHPDPSEGEMEVTAKMSPNHQGQGPYGGGYENRLETRVRA